MDAPQARRAKHANRTRNAAQTSAGAGIKSGGSVDRTTRSVAGSSPKARGGAASLAVVFAAILVSACATTRAATPSERPSLDIPIPPPRVIIPVPASPGTPAVEPVGDLPGNTTAPPARPRPQRDRTESAKPADPKPEEIKPVEPPPPPVVAPPKLTLPEAGDSVQLTAQIRDIVDRVRRTLQGIPVAPLSDALKKAHADATMFANQADEALKEKNLVFAKELAEKAERLAKELQGRRS
jgi:histone H3/H4